MNLSATYKMVGKKQVLDKIVDLDTKEEIIPWYSNYKCAQDFIDAGVRYIVPMTAKEEDREEELDKMLAPNSGYLTEEKLDGTRATVHIGKTSTRVFSRRESVETGWFCENTDSLPHLRKIKSKKFHDTVLDCEMIIPNRPFSDASGTLNCNWDTAITRQIELGFILPHCFDIVYYKGIYIAKMPLWKRKQYLRKALDGIDSQYLRELSYSDTNLTVPMTCKIGGNLNSKSGWKELYPSLYAECVKQGFLNCRKHEVEGQTVTLSKRAYYEYIVANGGEGIILKDKNGKYYHKRGREYTKLKKFLTRECIITAFLEPTKEYSGGHIENWKYWVNNKTGEKVCKFPETQEFIKEHTAVTKYYFEDWVGNIQYAVLATDEEVEEWVKVNKCEPIIAGFIEEKKLLVVGDCSGFDEKQREEFTKNRMKYIGQVVEIKANELFIKTGKMRHPRFLRMRTDKSSTECTWYNHINC